MGLLSRVCFLFCLQSLILQFYLEWLQRKPNVSLMVWKHCRSLSRVQSILSRWQRRRQHSSPLNQVWKKVFWFLPRYMTPQTISLTEASLSLFYETKFCLKRKRPFQEKLLRCYKNLLPEAQGLLTKLRQRSPAQGKSRGLFLADGLLPLDRSQAQALAELHQVLIVSIPPAPPADLWLSTAGNDGSVALVPVRGTRRQLYPTPWPHSDTLSSYKKWHSRF